jgi:hypothetical protein
MNVYRMNSHHTILTILSLYCHVVQVAACSQLNVCQRAVGQTYRTLQSAKQFNY